MRPRFSLRTLLILVTLCAFGLAIAYWIPRSKQLPALGYYVGYYRGLGLMNGRGYFGKNWYRAVVRDDADCYWEVDVNGLGFNHYRGYYSSGVLREEGMCMVVEIRGDIVPQRHDLLHGKFYDPQGKLIAEVKNRTGKRILCGPDGTRLLEVDLVNGKWAHVTMRHPNGQLELDGGFVNGHHHGEWVSYYSNGQVRSRGEYSNGQASGVWHLYREDGTLNFETDYTVKGI